jgi:hypothetical protein
MTSLNGSFQGLIPKEPEILARNVLRKQIPKPRLVPKATQTLALPIMNAPKTKLEKRTCRPGIAG